MPQSEGSRRRRYANKINAARNDVTRRQEYARIQQSRERSNSNHVTQVPERFRNQAAAEIEDEATTQDKTMEVGKVEPAFGNGGNSIVDYVLANAVI